MRRLADGDPFDRRTSHQMWPHMPMTEMIANTVTPAIILRMGADVAEGTIS
jgi:hypothetical protein